MSLSTRPTCRAFLRTPWPWAAWGIASLTLLPLLILAAAFLEPQRDIWQHLYETVLGEMILNTIWLVFGVSVGVGVLGISTAWLVAVCEFPGRRWWNWSLLLPLAIPAYVMAFVDIGLLDFTGVIQSTWRRWGGNSRAFPAIRSRGGVVMVMSLALYPYVYLLARQAFLTQGSRALEVAQSLGMSRWQGFWRVALPLARPWIAGGVLLVIMETLADFGTVATFNYDTFTTAIYKAWFALFSLSAAAQLACVLVMLVGMLLLWEQFLQRHKHYHATGRVNLYSPRLMLHGWQALAASTWCALIILLAFIIPVVQLLWWAAQVIATDWDSRYVGFIGRSLLLSGLAVAVILGLSLVLAYAQRRLLGCVRVSWAVRLATLGYALPGSVLAVGIFLPLARLDAWLGVHWSLNFFSSGLLGLLLAYAVRFLAVGFGPIEAAMRRITRNQEEAARLHGWQGWALVRLLHLPLLRSGIITAALLVFVDVMKEMPITLMMRPFGWDTLAVRVFEMTSEGQWEQAALPAVMLVLVGLLPVLALTQQLEKQN